MKKMLDKNQGASKQLAYVTHFVIFLIKNPVKNV